MVQFYLVDEFITSDVTSKEVSVAGTGSQPRKGLSSFCIVSEIADPKDQTFTRTRIKKLDIYQNELELRDYRGLPVP